METLKERIVELYEEGCSYRDIVKKLNCSKGTISYHLSAETKLKTLERQRDRRNMNRRFVVKFKESQVCTDCGLDYPYWILEFDHCRGEPKIGNIAEMMNDYTLAAIKHEISKCDVVCANCHKHRTWMRKVKEDELAGC